MIGFPYHAAGNYINKIRQYYDVTIIDDNDIKELPQIVMVDGTMIDKETGEILAEPVTHSKIENKERMNAAVIAVANMVALISNIYQNNHINKCDKINI